MKRRILLVEDVRDFREALAFALEHRGFAVEQAADGMEALTFAKARVPDVVILDIGLPRLDGFYVAELWRRDPMMQNIPVIALSAFADENYEQRALRSGCAAALRKPASADDVVREINKLISARSP